jgi:hypothetical protein
MDKELLNAHIEFQLHKSRHGATLHRALELITESTKQTTLRGGVTSLRDVEIVDDEAWRRRESGNLIAEFVHGATEHDDGTEIRNLGRGTPHAQPPTEIPPVVIAILYGSGGENPPTRGGLCNGHGRHPPTGILAIPNDVSLIENDPLKGGPCHGFPIHTDLGICGEPDTGLLDVCLLDRNPLGGAGHQSTGNVATGTKLLEPAGDESRRTDNESPERQWGILEESDGLEGLSEPHVVTEDAAAAHGSGRILAGHHPADALNLVIEIVNTIAGREECRVRHVRCSSFDYGIVLLLPAPSAAQVTFRPRHLQQMQESNTHQNSGGMPLKHA